MVVKREAENSHVVSFPPLDFLEILSKFLLEIVRKEAQICRELAVLLFGSRGSSPLSRLRREMKLCLIGRGLFFFLTCFIVRGTVHICKCLLKFCFWILK